LDTGYANKNETGVKETFIANSGVAIDLRGVTISLISGSNVDDTPVIGASTVPVLNPVSVSTNVWTVSAIIDRTDIDDMAKIILFDSLKRTKGIKLLYYTGAVIGDMSYATNTINDMTSTENSISVVTTKKFPSTGTIKIDDEQMTYTGLLAQNFIGLTRGVNGTTAATHSSGASVFFGGEDAWNNVITRLGEEHLNGETNQEGNTIVDIHTNAVSPGGELENSGDPIPHLHVFLTGFTINQTATKNKLQYRLTLKQTT